ncbi:Formamidopyrimidine-DNA glycosylase [[Mycoplasma] cavipharyngis]|uniref:DNA-formamidopyrimidine glycosylase n=1 Tax=[Mycoplasma] cavipharyngis TaxID=92757 RepID=UPI00370400B3
MPELPEVQVFINHLKPLVTNHKIIGLQLNCPKVLKNISYQQFAKNLINFQFTDLTRIGKYLIFHLSNQKVLVLHLRMEGKPFYQHQDQPYDQKHVLFKIQFDNHYELRYHDMRRFGTVHLFDQKDYLAQKELAKLGLDPTQTKFNVKYVKNQLSQSLNRSVKTVLLDQTKISGIGNIYADEILFAAKIHPKTLVKNLNDADFKMITKAAKSIIKSAIKHHGTTILSFQYKHNQSGTYQNRLKVHTRKGLKCHHCQTKINKIKVNNRGTYLCDQCQVWKT